MYGPGHMKSQCRILPYPVRRWMHACHAHHAGCAYTQTCAELVAYVTCTYAYASVRCQQPVSRPCRSPETSHGALIIGLFAPAGPVNIHDSVQRAMVQPSQNHRDPWFQPFFQQVSTLCICLYYDACLHTHDVPRIGVHSSLRSDLFFGILSILLHSLRPLCIQA